MQQNELNLDNEIIRAIKEMGFKSFTNVQTRAIPLALSGKNIVVQSKTGSGKTAVFGLSIIQKIREKKGLQALVITPTRELCLQVSSMLKGFSKYKNLKISKITGGENIEAQKKEIQEAEIVVATPGRLLDLIRNSKISFDSLKWFIVDEIDRMSDFGFIGDVEKIINRLPQRQTMVFSATINDDVKGFVSKHLKNPEYVLEEKLVDKNFLEQVYYETLREKKFSLLVFLLKNNYDGISLVFCKKRHESELVAKNVRKNGINAIALHGGIKHNKRVKNIRDVINQKFDVIVATDLMARGLDLKGVNYVYNYDLPESPEDYIHRIGRTARMGNKGKAITIITPEENRKLEKIMKTNKIDIRREKLPVFPHVPFYTKRKYKKNQTRNNYHGENHSNKQRHNQN